MGGSGFRCSARSKIALIPAPYPSEHGDPDQGQEGEPHNGGLPAGYYDEAASRGPSAAGVAANLKERLGESESSAGSEVRDARSFRMEDDEPIPTRATAIRTRGKVAGEGEQNQTGERETHSDCQRKRLWPPVRVKADEGLKDRSRQLVGQRDKADMNEIQM